MKAVISPATIFIQKFSESLLGGTQPVVILAVLILRIRVFFHEHPSRFTALHLPGGEDLKYQHRGGAAKESVLS